MSDFTFGGTRVISGSISFPYYGAPVGDLVLATSSDLPATMSPLVIGNLTQQCTIARQATFAASRSARVVGGANKWRTTLPARGYSHEAGVKLSSVLNDVARECGETIVVASDRVIGKHYIREQAKAERVLSLELDGHWYVDLTGVTRTVERQTSAIVTPFTVISWSGGKGLFEIATEDLASWQPGRKFSAPTVPATQTISSVTIEFDNDGKTRLHVLTTDTTKERFRTDLQSMIRAEIAALTYSGVWEYIIVSGTT